MPARRKLPACQNCSGNRAPISVVDSIAQRQHKTLTETTGAEKNILSATEILPTTCVLQNTVKIPSAPHRVRSIGLNGDQATIQHENDATDHVHTDKYLRWRMSGTNSRRPCPWR